MRHRGEDALKALSEALSLRNSLGYSLWNPVAVYDCAEQLGIEVRFIALPSLEAMYSKGTKPIIVLSSLRPPGRQVFNCAHEIGHHIFGHGNHIHELLTHEYNPNLDRNEFIAQTFAGFFLMPKSAVEHAFVTRGWSVQSCTPQQIYVVSGWFGVGYTTLIDHMQYSLRIISSSRADQLRKIEPRKIRESIIGNAGYPNLIVADSHWLERAIDIRVGDAILVPKGTAAKNRNRIEFAQTCGKDDLLRAVKPGIEQIYDPSNGWSAFVRVSKPGFVGRSMFQHLEDDEDD